MTQKIEPTYVTREQVKRLKEKGFNENCNGHLVIKTGGIGKGKQFIHEGRLDYDDIYLEYVEENIPEQWQVVEWLRVNHEIEVYALRYTFSKGEFVGKKYMFVVEKYKKNFNPDLGEYHFEEEPLESSRELNYNSPQEAYSAAFDYILNNLI